MKCEKLKRAKVCFVLKMAAATLFAINLLSIETHFIGAYRSMVGLFASEMLFSVFVRSVVLRRVTSSIFFHIYSILLAESINNMW